MTDAIVARRYAGAIFALGKQQGDEALSRYGSDLAALGDMLAASPKLDAALKSPVISIDEKKAVMGKLLKKIKADKTVSNFCLLLADKERLAYLGEIVGWYGKLLDDAKGIIRGTLTTAVELTDNKRAELKAELEKKVEPLKTEILKKPSSLPNKHENLNMTNQLKISRFNPLDYMDSDDEIVDYLVDSYFDDPDGNVYARACQFVTDADNLQQRVGFFFVRRLHKLRQVQG